MKELHLKCSQLEEATELKDQLQFELSNEKRCMHIAILKEVCSFPYGLPEHGMDPNGPQEKSTIRL